MRKDDFLNLAQPDMLGEFVTPILDNAPIWKILNAGKTYVYGYHHKLSLVDAVVSPIDLENFTKMLASGELSSKYYVIYLLGEEINNKKIENQPVSENSDMIEDIRDHVLETEKFNTIIVPSTPPVEEDNFDYSVGSTPTPTKTVWDLDMHESLELGNYQQVQRVPGGWIYATFHHADGNGQNITESFVPYEAQKFNTGCVLCGNTIDKTANIVVDVLDHLNEMGESITALSLEVDTTGALLNYVKEYLKMR